MSNGVRGPQFPVPFGMPEPQPTGVRPANAPTMPMPMPGGLATRQSNAAAPRRNALLPSMPDPNRYRPLAGSPPHAQHAMPTPAWMPMPNPHTLQRPAKPATPMRVPVHSQMQQPMRMPAHPQMQPPMQMPVHSRMQPQMQMPVHSRMQPQMQMPAQVPMPMPMPMPMRRPTQPRPPMPTQAPPRMPAASPPMAAQAGPAAQPLSSEPERAAWRQTLGLQDKASVGFVVAHSQGSDQVRAGLSSVIGFAAEATAAYQAQRPHHPDPARLDAAYHNLVQELSAAKQHLEGLRQPAASPPQNARFQDVIAPTLRFEHEQHGAAFGTKVAYLDEQQRQQYRLTVKDGLIYDARGQPFDTRDGGTVFQGGAQGRAIIVMDHDGNFYAHTHPAIGKFHHTSFLAGAPVAFAGEVEVTGGQMKLLNRMSGHYRPDEKHLHAAAHQFVALGVAPSFNVVATLR